MTSWSFSLLAEDPSGARSGRITTAHGTIETPIFMPVGTQGVVKAMTVDQLLEMNAQIILGNTYHLYLRPGEKLIEKLGGLHHFMRWPKPILTDSGGYQVFSLGELRKIAEQGVTFQSHIDGSKHQLTPEKSIEIQEALGADIAMQFDECPPFDASRDYIADSMALSIRWAKRSQAAKKRHAEEGYALFGIMQGGMHRDLRQSSAEQLIALNLEGYAIGGLSVGEPKEMMKEVLSYAPGFLPKDKPRYLMGVGKPEDLFMAVEQGVDMFDCVLPTRNARNGQVFTHMGPINIKRAEFTEDNNPLDQNCHCPVCRKYSRAYLRHLFRCREITGLMLLTTHNLYFYLNLMEKMRQAIRKGTFAALKKEFLDHYSSNSSPSLAR
ncbi:tRNA guanosine(34) transglycosylase Tgt [Magnetococcales bacterium HHB-1]